MKYINEQIWKSGCCSSEIVRYNNLLIVISSIPLFILLVLNTITDDFQIGSFILHTYDGSDHPKYRIVILIAFIISFPHYQQNIKSKGSFTYTYLPSSSQPIYWWNIFILEEVKYDLQIPIIPRSLVILYPQLTVQRRESIIINNIESRFLSLYDVFYQLLYVCYLLFHLLMIMQYI